MSVIDRTLGVPSPFLGAPFGAPSEILIGRSVALRTRVRTPCRVLRDTGMGFSGRAERNHYINFGPFRYTIDLEELIVLLLFFFFGCQLLSLYTRWPTEYPVTHIPWPKKIGAECQASPSPRQEATVAGPRDLRYGSSPKLPISDDPANTCGHFIWRWSGWCRRMQKDLLFMATEILDCVEHTKQLKECVNHR